MNSIWNKNITAFCSRFPGLAQIYSNIIEEITQKGEEAGKIFSFLTVHPAKNGSLTAEEGGIALHSLYNPEREAAVAAEQIIQKNKSTVIFLGCGLGYQICSFTQKCAAEKLERKTVIIEPEPLHFFAALFYTNWQDVFKIENLIIALECPLDTIIGLIEGNQINTGNRGVSDSFIFAIPSFIEHAKQYFDSVITLIERNRNKNDINAATYKKFEKLWIRNSMKNIARICECGTVNELVGEGTDIVGAEGIGRAGDFILVAAGPTLETVLPKIKEWSQRTVIVCVETALHALLKAGIQPDFIVITDPQYYAYRHIAGLEAQDSILVCPLSVHPAVFRFKCRQILLCSEMFPVSSYFESQLGAFGDLGAGGSVASSAWNLCRLLGAKNIYLAGLDLSYPAGQTHIKGSSAEETFLAGAGRLSTMQDKNSAYRFGANPEYSVDYEGNPVLTDARMKMFAWWFESRIAACPEVKTWTLSSRSMKIPGVEVAEDVEKGPFVVPVLRQAQGPHQMFGVPELVEGGEKITDVTSSFYTTLHTLTTLINQAVEKCIIGGPSLETDLAHIEAQIAASPLAEIVRLARPNTSDRLEQYKSLQKTMTLYTSLISC